MYLIQRCKFKDSFDEEASFDVNIKLDYMGSAEFEFGVIPASLKEACKNLEEMKWFKVSSVKNVNDSPIFYLALEKNDELEKFIELKAKSEISGSRTKESVRLHDMVIGRYPYDSYSASHIWWLVDDPKNPIMWVFGKQDRIKLQKTLENTREKFLLNGKI